MDKPCTIIASGTSVTRKDVAAIERTDCFILGVNRAFEIVSSDRLDALYACDQKFWLHYGDQVPGACRKYTLDKGWQDKKLLAEHRDLTVMQALTAEGISTKWPCLCTGQNSGYQALNLAYLLGFREVYLLGYDLKPGPGGKIHWHDDHPKPMHNPKADRLKKWRRHYEDAAPLYRDLGCSVTNLSRETALLCFHCMTLEGALDALSQK